MVDVKPIDGSDPVENARVILNELERFSPELANLPQILVLNKIDQVPEEELNELCTHIVAELGWTGDVFRTSTLMGEGTDAVKYHLMNEIELEREREIEDPLFAEAQKARFERLEAEVRLNTEAQREAYRAARRAAREGIDLNDDGIFDDDDDGVEVIYVP